MPPTHYYDYLWVNPRLTISDHPDAGKSEFPFPFSTPSPHFQCDDGTVRKYFNSVTAVRRCAHRVQCVDGGHEDVTEEVLLSIFDRMKKDLSKKRKRTNGNSIQKEIVGDVMIFHTHTHTHTHAHTHTVHRSLLFRFLLIYLFTIMHVISSLDHC